MLMNRTILLVDGDDEESGIAAVLRPAMTARGSKLIGVRERVKALDMLRTRSVDLVLLYMKVPAGLEICRAIRGCWDVPIIILSVCDSAQDRVEALEGGADDVLAKPFHIDELLARMGAALRRTVFFMDSSRCDLVRLPCGHYQTPDEILRLAARIVEARTEVSRGGKSSRGAAKENSHVPKMW